MKRLATSLGLAAVVLASALLPGAAQEKSKPGFGKPQIDAVSGPAKVLDDAQVVNFGKVVYKGKIDVNPTLDRIRAGKHLKHPNDGAIFGNKEERLPRQKDRD